MSPTLVRNFGLDVARVLAVTLVMVYHAFGAQATILGAFGGSGWMGVDLFFVLSGFLVAEGFERLEVQRREKALAEGKADEGGSLYAAQLGEVAHAFYRKRLKRVVPTYFVTVALVTLMTVPLPALRAGALWHLPWYLTFTANHRMIYAPVLWSISVEMQFYLILPLVWAGKVGGRLVDWVRESPITALGLFLLIPALCRTVIYLEHPEVQAAFPQVFTPGTPASQIHDEFGFQIYASFFGHMDGLLLGLWLGIVSRGSRAMAVVWHPAVVQRWSRLALAMGGCGFLATYVVLAPWRTWMPRPALLGTFGFSFVALYSLMLVMGLRECLGDGSEVPPWLRGKVEWVSDRIFSLYLGQAIASTVFGMGVLWPGLSVSSGLLVGLTYMGCALVAGHILYDSVERKWSRTGVSPHDAEAARASRDEGEGRP